MSFVKRVLSATVESFCFTVLVMTIGASVFALISWIHRMM